MGLWGDQRAKCAMCGWEYNGPDAAKQYADHTDKHARLVATFTERTELTAQDKEFLRKVKIVPEI